MPIHDPQLLRAIEELPEQPWQGRVWRHMFNDYAPERVNTSGARWNPPGTGAIYTAADRDTAIAEGQHAIDVQPRRFFRKRVLYELGVDVQGVVDLTASGALDAVGLTPTDIEDDLFDACQRVGGAAAWIGRGGIIVPSARHDGSNLVIIVGHGGDVGAEIERLSTEVLFDHDAAG